PLFPTLVRGTVGTRSCVRVMMLPGLLVVISTGAATAQISALSLHDALPIFAQPRDARGDLAGAGRGAVVGDLHDDGVAAQGVLEDRKSTRLNSSHVKISYAVFCLKKKQTSPAPREGH